MMRLSDLLTDANDAIRAHHASGHFDTIEATARLVANGLSPEDAAELLAQPVPDEMFARYRTWPEEYR